MELGYACINTELRKDNITTNRGMIKKTFLAKGIEYCSELALQNVRDLFKIVQWNTRNNIKVFRISSDLFPWMSEYNLTDLPDWNKIENILKAVGNHANTNNMRLSFHPGPFNILCSPKQDVVDKTVKELDQHAFVLDTMGLEVSPLHKVNIHIGGAYGDKVSAINRWIDNFQLLQPSTQKRLTIENDDKPSMYAVEDLVHISSKTGCPIVFDFHHHDCHPGVLSKQEALHTAIDTWPEGITPMTHYSSSRRLFEDDSVKNVAHADYLYNQIPFVDNFKFDVVLEAKAKEDALIKYRKEFI
ncbi:MAG: UV DNA damage repair endonuclease UvsE [Cytophagales bacterium]|nr:UV DNA damage repair endonuclease UvsE [Cytophagales bacterium]